ncbi:MAG: serine acetyltransferase [Leptolyngbya sp. RL_3_1]|nr:serine acetyltransferase [Leptolyngbya sp. RL_3_1]
MKTWLRESWQRLQRWGCLLLLIPYGLTTERPLIQADIQRWAELLNYGTAPLVRQLLQLLSQMPEFRNLYYHRLSQGNLLARVSLWGLRPLYPGCGTLFIDQSCTIGPGLFLQHAFSTIIMADIGENCWINQQVTIGYRDRTGRPHLGNGVRITAGAKVIGNVSLGDNVTVGANAVVVKNVPADCVVVGVPAHIIRREGRKVQEELV